MKVAELPSRAGTRRQQSQRQLQLRSAAPEHLHPAGPGLPPQQPRISDSAPGTGQGGCPRGCLSSLSCCGAFGAPQGTTCLRMQEYFAAGELPARPPASAGGGSALPLSILPLLIAALPQDGKRGCFVGCLGVDTGNFGSFEEVQSTARFRAVVSTMRWFETFAGEMVHNLSLEQKGKTGGKKPWEKPCRDTVMVPTFPWPKGGFKTPCQG